MDKKQIERARRIGNAGRNYIYKRALRQGDDLMPCFVVDLINKFFFTYNKIEKTELLKDIYSSCGFCLDNSDYF